MIDVALTFLIRVAGAMLALALQSLLSRLMPLDDFGAQALFWSMLLAVGGFGAFGFAESSVRFLPRYLLRRREAQAKAFEALAIRYSLAGSFALALMLVSVAHYLPLEKHVVTTLQYVAVGLPFFALEYLAESVARARGYFRIAVVTIYLVRPLIIAAICLGLYWYGVPLLAPVVGAVLLLCLCGTSLFLAFMLLFPVSSKRPSPSQRKFWQKGSVPLLLASGLEDLGSYADILLVGFLLGPAEAGLYFAATRILVLCHFAQFAITYVAGRTFSVALAEGGTEELAKANRRATIQTLIATTIAAVGIVITGPWLLALFGPTFAASYWPLVILTLGTIARGFSGQAMNVLLVAGRQFQLIWLNTICLLISVALLVVFVPPYGLIGAAIATSLGQAARSLLFYWQAQQVTDVKKSHA